MEQNNVKENTAKKDSEIPSEKRKESTSHRHSRKAGAPWWLVIVLVLGLLGMASYIAWMNSATLKNRMGYVSDFWDSRDSEAELLSYSPGAESVGAWEDTLMNSEFVATDSVVQDWKSSPELAQEITNTEPVTGTTALPTTPELAEPSPVTEPAPLTPVAAKPTYYIKAGEFASKRAAQLRIGELRQGNYRGKIIEPDSEGGSYIVSVGEFTSFKKAKERARAIGFIMDIRTSVVEKQ